MQTKPDPTDAPTGRCESCGDRCTAEAVRINDEDDRPWWRSPATWIWVSQCCEAQVIPDAEKV